MQKPIKLAVLIPAAGASTRFNTDGATRSKLDADLGGRPLLHRTLDLFNTYANPDCDIIHTAVAGPHDPDAFEAFKLRHGDTLALLGMPLIKGSAAHRYETVAALLNTIPDDATHIAVHDAARPGCSPRLIDRLVAAAASHPAVVPAMPAGATLKQASSTPLQSGEPDPLAGILGDSAPASDQAWPIEHTLPRHHVWLAQTPQIFERQLLLRAYEQTNLDSTDDAELVERLGEQVVVITGEPGNIKVTYPEDLAIAHAIMGLRPSADRPAHKRF